MLKDLYEYHCRNVPSDINEHLPTLKRLAEDCKHVTEFGVRTAVSSTALLMGCDKVVSYDLESCDNVEYLQKICPNRDFRIGNTLEIEIEKTDMLFIDTLHNGDQLEKELERHADNVSKYIAFHDTTTFGKKGETNENGLVPFMKKFLANHKEWREEVVFTNNNGLTIRRRLPEVVVYTAIYGDYEVLKKQPEQTIPCKFVCFTDMYDVDAEPGAKEQWKIVVYSTGEEGFETDALRAKYLRTHPFMVFPQQIVIYMDGSARLAPDGVEKLMNTFLLKSDIMALRHGERDCIYDEAEFCADVGKYTNPKMFEQCAEYYGEGHPKHYGLSATGLLVFNKSDKLIDALHKRWLECVKRGPNCQLSFDHIMRKNGIKRQFFNPPGGVWENKFIKFYPHKSKNEAINHRS